MLTYRLIRSTPFWISVDEDRVTLATFGRARSVTTRTRLVARPTRASGLFNEVVVLTSRDTTFVILIDVVITLDARHNVSRWTVALAAQFVTLPTFLYGNRYIHYSIYSVHSTCIMQ